MKNISIDPLSYIAIPIALKLEETNCILAYGTAFIYEFNEKNYLITNWHNVTGINPVTKKNLGKHGGIPDLLEFKLLIQQSPHLKWKSFSINLYDNNLSDWLIHPEFKEQIDVVAIEIEIPDDFEGLIKPINKIKFDKFKLEVSDDVFILGFPYHSKGLGSFPIWKKGSVATEPGLNVKELPLILIDTASRSGMSGAPVIYRRTGIHGGKDGKITPDMFIGQIQGFVGIYSGRILGKSELDAQLGMVWKKEVIKEIIIGQFRDDRNFA